MPSATRLARLVRLATLPETRGLIVAAAQSETLRGIGQRAVLDRAALVRDLVNPANARELVRKAALHPAARELASAGLVFLPGRYLPLGWAATWATQRVLRRYIDPLPPGNAVEERRKRAPFDGGAGIEIRQIFEPDDFGEALTPELRA